MKRLPFVFIITKSYNLNLVLVTLLVKGLREHIFLLVCINDELSGKSYNDIVIYYVSLLTDHLNSERNEALTALLTSSIK